MNLGVALDSIAVLVVDVFFYKFYVGNVLRSDFCVLVLMSQSYLVLLVVVVIVSSLLPLLIVDSYLLVTGTVADSSLQCWRKVRAQVEDLFVL